MARDFNHHNAFLSEGAPSPLWVWHFPETPHQTRDNTDFPRPLRQSEARLRLACPPLARRGGAPHERGDGEFGVHHLPPANIDLVRPPSPCRNPPLWTHHLGVTAMSRKRHGDSSLKPSPCLARRISARQGNPTTIRSAQRGSRWRHVPLLPLLPAPGPSLAWREKASCRSSSEHQTMRSECGENAFRGARLAFHMLLASLRFRHHRLTACAGPPTPEVEGSEPPIFGPRSSAGPPRVCTRRPFPGSFPSLNQSQRKAFETISVSSGKCIVASD